MTGESPTHILGAQVGKMLSKRRLRFKENPVIGRITDLPQVEFPWSCMKPVKKFSVGTLVGRALVRGGHATYLEARLRPIIEFRDKFDKDDWTGSDWGDPKKVYGSLSSGSRSGLAGKFVANAETGANIGRDLHTVLTGGNNYNPSASSGNFKLTPNSPNTARITVGPERRTRRKKYEWEKADTRRKIHKAVLTGVAVGGVAAGAALLRKGEGSIWRGAKRYASEAGEKSADVAQRVKTVFTGKPYIPKSKTGKTTTTATKQVAEMIRKRREKATAGAGAATGSADFTMPRPGSPEYEKRK